MILSYYYCNAYKMFVLHVSLINNWFLYCSNFSSASSSLYLSHFQLHKITYHRAAVTSVKVVNTCDVLISSSHDKTICLWSLDDYSLLNSMQMNSPVLRIDISCDSVSTFYGKYKYKSPHLSWINYCYW